ncbi:MAG TPA: AAA family ATPase [Puia sp.]|nr:AAA family ATPase [Puia sp.]
MRYSRELNTNCLFVITGGPGVGKTTLLEELQKRLFTCIPEVAREIIKEQVATDGYALPWKNRELYLQMMFNRSVDSYLSAKHNDRPFIFFDRGIPDSLTYADIIGFEKTAAMENAVRQYRYNRNVFYLSPWRDIYKTDEERKQTWEEAIATSELNAEIYIRYNYTLIDVPKDIPEKRADFILSWIDETYPGQTDDF